MDANVRAAAAETLRLCREAGHDVSPAVVALYVQAQRLAEVHPNELVARCAAKLAAAGDPALETLKMQMDVEATRALRAHAAAETRRARAARDPFEEDTEANASVSARASSKRACFETTPVATKDALRALDDRAPAYSAANASTRRDISARLVSAERLCARYAAAVEHLGTFATPSADDRLRSLTDEMNNRHAFADALRRLLDECDRGAETVDALAAEAAATETAPDDADGPFAGVARFSEVSRRETRQDEASATRAPRGASDCARDMTAGGVPASNAFPALSAIGALRGAITEEIDALNDVRAVFATLRRHAKPFASSLTDGMLRAATEARHRAEAREVPMARPEFEHDRHTPDRIYDDDLRRAMAIKSAAEIVPGDTLELDSLALRGYDAHAVVKRGGYSGAPALAGTARRAPSGATPRTTPRTIHRRWR